MVTRTTALVALGSALLMLVACGPIEYVNQVTRKASSAVDEAKDKRADQLAPYEYTLAVEYLHKAREEASFADFQAANRFGRKAAEAAKLAAELAEARAADPQKAARELPPKNLEQGSDSLAPLDDDAPEAAGDQKK
jgi:hypothetical protein